MHCTQHKDTFHQCYIELYPVLRDNPQDEEHIEQIVHKHGLFLRGKGKRWLGRFQTKRQCVKWCKRNVDPEILKQSEAKYRAEQTEKEQNAIDKTCDFWNSESLSTWMTCIQDLDYTRVHRHYCREDQPF